MSLRDPQERLATARREFGEFGGVNAGIEVSTTFTVLEADTLGSIFSGEVGPEKGGCYLYGRSFNPTVKVLGRQLAALEGSEAAYACSSGMAAISCTLLSLCQAGDHIVASNTVYGGTFALLKEFLPLKCGISCTFVDVRDLAAVREAVTNKTKVVYTESLSNPTLVVADIPALAEIAHSKGAQLVVDNTFTPMVLSPIHWGADVVVHSLTKFVSGASDIIAGAVCGRASFITSLMDLHLGSMMLLGPTMDPKIASELSLRIPTLGLRMAEHSRRALALAERVQQAGGQVTYPGLPQHPQHELLAKLANPGYGYGGVLTLELGSLPRAKRLMERLQNVHGFGYMAVSLGYFDTLMSASAVSTSSELSSEELASAGISSGLVRMSIGITGSLEQRWAQLHEALVAVQALPEPAQAPAGVPSGEQTAVQTVHPAAKAEPANTQASSPGAAPLSTAPSWHSLGSAASEHTGQEGEGAPTVAAGARPAAAPGAADPPPGKPAAQAEAGVPVAAGADAEAEADTDVRPAKVARLE